MNREIKFRAWSFLTKRMSPCADFPTWMLQYQFLSDSNPIKHFKSENAVLLQSTGFRDKNLKDIYHGDILNIDGCNTEVCYYNGAFVVKDYFEGQPYTYLSSFDETDIEVIGNIYQNPELLK